MADEDGKRGLGDTSQAPRSEKLCDLAAGHNNPLCVHGFQRRARSACEAFRLRAASCERMKDRQPHPARTIPLHYVMVFVYFHLFIMQKPKCYRFDYLGLLGCCVISI